MAKFTPADTDPHQTPDPNAELQFYVRYLSPDGKLYTGSITVTANELNTILKKATIKKKRKWVELYKIGVTALGVPTGTNGGEGRRQPTASYSPPPTTEQERLIST